MWFVGFHRGISVAEISESVKCVFIFLLTAARMAHYSPAMKESLLSPTEAIHFVRELVPVEGVVVWNPKNRQKIADIATLLKASGQIDFRVITRNRPEGGFIVAAVKEPK